MKKFVVAFLILVVLILISFIGVFLKETKTAVNPISSIVPIESSGKAKPQIKKVKMILVGDIMLGRSVNMRSLDMDNVNYPFEKVADKLRAADIVFANLESPIVEKCPRIEHGFTFCADPKMIGGLLYSGVDIVTLANNHALNFGSTGFAETKKYLTENGIKWVGDGNLEVIDKNGTRFGFLGFDYVAGGPTQNDLKLVRDSDKKADILIVAPHWGYEYKSVANQNQVAWAKKLVGAGADIISGSHPHWVQNTEYFTDLVSQPDLPDDLTNVKPVYYSLGNFVFDQMWSEETKKGLAILLTFEDAKIVKEERLPTYISSWAQPEWSRNKN